MTRTVDVAIVGSGCTGLFLALALTKHEGRTCAVIDEAPFGGYASTKNQGWIHSGSLYAAKGQVNVGLECAEAYHELMLEYPGAIHRHRRAFYGFHEEAFEDAVNLMRDLPIRFEPMSPSDTPEGLIRASTLPCLVEVDDRPFDTNALLSSVLRELRAQGGGRTSTCATTRALDIPTPR